MFWRRNNSKIRLGFSVSFNSSCFSFKMCAVFLFFNNFSLVSLISNTSRLGLPLQISTCHLSALLPTQMSIHSFYYITYKALVTYTSKCYLYSYSAIYRIRLYLCLRYIHSHKIASHYRGSTEKKLWFEYYLCARLWTRYFIYIIIFNSWTIPLLKKY